MYPSCELLKTTLKGAERKTLWWDIKKKKGDMRFIPAVRRPAERGVMSH